MIRNEKLLVLIIVWMRLTVRVGNEVGSNPAASIGKNKSLFVGLASFSGVGPIFI